MTTDRFTQRILRYVSEKGYLPQSQARLAQALAIDRTHRDEFNAACEALLESGRILRGADHALRPAAPPGTFVGTFRGHPRGYGFVVPEDRSTHGDVYVSADAAGGAMTGDQVRVRVVKRGKRGGEIRFEGRILEILRRGQSRFVGEVRRTRARWFVQPDGGKFDRPILLPDASARNVSPGDQVVVEITEYPTDRSDARGVILRVLGRAGEPDVDLLSVMEQYDLPRSFPEPVLADARRVTDAFSRKDEFSGREDLRGLTIVTIDPDDAKDFDDAISLETLDDEHWELGVHIADVSHFVREGSALDEEAKLRANSVYLPGIVLPMLPELLSNGLCSLQEREPRLCKSVFIQFDAAATVRRARFADSVIRSSKRLTYRQAQSILDGSGPRTSAKVVALLKRMDTLAHRIRTRRLKSGMLELDLPEVELVRDRDGRVVDAQPGDSSFTHKIIEMFMVEANEAVARELARLGLPFLRRTHGAPKTLADGGLRSFLRVLGHRLPADADRFDLQGLLEEVQGHDDGFAVHLAVLKSMQAAEYSPEPEGHFALASEHYCHFTSPIRRYADLTVHRLFPYLTGAAKQPDDPSSSWDPAGLRELGAHCVARERRAEDAERELTLVLILRMLENHIGDEYPGIVTGVSNTGLFVRLVRYQIDGLLRFESLADDHWRVDPSRACVVGMRTRATLKVGDRLAIRLAAVDVPRRRLELAPTEQRGRSRRAKSFARHEGSPRTRSRRTSDENGAESWNERVGGPRPRRRTLRRRR